MELQLIPDSHIIKQKRGVVIRIDGQKEGFLHKETTTLTLDKPVTLRLKLDRLSGSPTVTMDRSTSIHVRINHYLKRLMILNAVIFFLIAGTSAFSPALMTNIGIIVLVSILCLLTLASFTFWRKKWIILKMTEI